MEDACLRKSGRPALYAAGDAKPSGQPSNQGRGDDSLLWHHGSCGGDIPWRRRPGVCLRRLAVLLAYVFADAIGDLS